MSHGAENNAEHCNFVFKKITLCCHIMAPVGQNQNDVVSSNSPGAAPG